jgi:tRNA dimethylallyltransferase
LAPLVVICGPTGVGKTAVAVALGRHLPIEVVSADSRQVYRGMDVGTGKPTAAERTAVPHHVVDVADPDERYQAARFRQDAEEAIAAIRARGRQPVVVGGTGLYIRALVRGLDPAPPADPTYRQGLAALAARAGRPALHRRLRELAPEVALRLHPNDHVRVIRALERLRAQGPGALASGRWASGPPVHRVRWFGLTLDRAILARRLAARAEAMVASGLLDEVRALLARGYDPALPALASIGYREFIRVARGQLGMAEALASMRRDTARYARRQWTWFRREPDIEWLDVDAAGGIEGTAETITRRLLEEGPGEPCQGAPLAPSVKLGSREPCE